MQGIRHTLKNIGVDEANAQRNIETSIANTTKWAHADIDAWTKDLSDFSTTLSKAVVEERLRGIEEEKAAGAAAWENQSFTEQEINDFREGREVLRQGNLTVNDHRAEALNNGASFQESKQLQKAASGWGLVGYAEAKASTAGREWMSWSKGQMLNNETLQVVRPGAHHLPDSDPNKFFTPNQAQTLPEKRAALAALRTKYFKDTGLMNIKPIVLAQKGGAYDQMSRSSSELLAEWRKQDAKEQSLEDLGDLWKEYERNKGQAGAVETLLSGLRLETTDGETALGYAGALDELEKGVEDLMDRDQFSDQDLKNLGNANSGFYDKNGKPIKFKDKWPTRWNNLKEKAIEHDAENSLEILKQHDTQSNKLEIDFRNLVKERRAKGQEITNDDGFVYLNKARDLGIKFPAYIGDFLTKEDMSDDAARVYLRKLAKVNGGLTEGDLAPFSGKIQLEFGKYVNQTSGTATATRNSRSSAVGGPPDMIRRKLRKYMQIGDGVLPGNENQMYGRALPRMQDFYERRVRMYMGDKFLMTEYNARIRAMNDLDLELTRGNPKGESEPGKLDQHQGGQRSIAKFGSWIFTEDEEIGVKQIEAQRELRRSGIDTINEIQSPNGTKGNVNDKLLALQTQKLPNIDTVDVNGNVIEEGSETRSILDEARRFRDGEVSVLPDYFHVVASRFPGLSAKDIADAQLMAHDGPDKGIFDDGERKLQLKQRSIPALDQRLKKFSPLNISQAKLISQDYSALASGNVMLASYSNSVFNQAQFLSVPPLPPNLPDVAPNEALALTNIRRYESDTSGGYNAVNQFGGNEGETVEGYSGELSGHPAHSGVNVTDLTLEEIMDLQSYDGYPFDSPEERKRWFDDGKLHAVGAYQFTRDTFKEFAEKSGLPLHTKFSPQVQDYMALLLLRERGVTPWVGPSNNANPRELQEIEAGRTPLTDLIQT